jgi:hypothetical protein
MFGRSSLPRTELTALRAVVPAARVLAWARAHRTGGDEVYAVALIGQFAVGRATTWAVTGWHDIVRGGWNPDPGRLRWESAGRTEFVDLIEPGRLPAVFRERVDAAVIIKETIGPEGGALIVSGHRRLGDPDAPALWRTTVVDPTTPPSPATIKAAERRLQELQRDFS